MDTSLNKPTFIAGYVVRTDRSKQYFNSNGNRNYRSNNLRRINDKRDLFQFFFKPQLKLDFDNNQPAKFKPELERMNEKLEHIGKRKWLKINVKNKGKATALNCRAKLIFLEGDSPIRPYDTKRLIWEELSPTMTILPKDEGELCHIAFSDTDFQNSKYAAMISTEQSENNPIISAQYGISKGKYKIRITVTAENEASTNKTFSLIVKDNDFDLEETE
jgi:hypothetical protein